MARDITDLLRAGATAEEELWSLVYQQLKGLAREVLRGRRRVAGPQTTTLVHEAYLRLLGGEGAVDYNDRRHFYAVAARAMRFVLVDEARRRFATKRGSGRSAEAIVDELDDGPADPLTHHAEEVLAVHQALDRLGEVNRRHVELVELRYFAGFTVDETADLMGVSRPTVVRDWRAVRTWLHGVLAEGSAEDSRGAEAP